MVKLEFRMTLPMDRGVPPVMVSYDFSVFRVDDPAKTNVLRTERIRKGSTIEDKFFEANAPGMVTYTVYDEDFTSPLVPDVAYNVRARASNITGSTDWAEGSGSLVLDGTTGEINFLAPTDVPIDLQLLSFRDVFRVRNGLCKSIGTGQEDWVELTGAATVGECLQHAEQYAVQNCSDGSEYPLGVSIVGLEASSADETLESHAIDQCWTASACYPDAVSQGLAAYALEYFQGGTHESGDHPDKCMVQEIHLPPPAVEKTSYLKFAQSQDDCVVWFQNDPKPAWFQFYDNFTASCWFWLPASYSRNFCLFCLGTDEYWDPMIFYLGGKNQWNGYGRDDGSSVLTWRSWTEFEGTTTPVPEQWHHIAITVEGNVLTHVLDGVVSTATMPDGTFDWRDNWDTNEFVWGGMHKSLINTPVTGDDSFRDGARLAECAVFDGVLTETEIQALRTTEDLTQHSRASDLAAYHRFQGNLDDSSGNGKPMQHMPSYPPTYAT
jgi:hypothetical protein